MAKRYFTSCTVCNTEFKVNKSKSNKYCSISCYRIAQRSGAYKHNPDDSIRRHQCAHCNALVIATKSIKRDGARSDVIYCNRDCYDKARAKAILDRRIECSHCKILCNPNKNTKSHFCSNECFKAHKKAQPKNCVNCNCFFTPLKFHTLFNRLISYNSGKTCSAKCNIEWISNNQQRKDKISFAFSGVKHPAWQGGSHKLSDRGAGWVKLRNLIKARDKYTCQKCGMTEQQSLQAYKSGLHVNHIKPFNQFGGKTVLANKPSNLESLCPSCHTITDAAWRRNNPVQFSLAGMFVK